MKKIIKSSIRRLEYSIYDTFLKGRIPLDYVTSRKNLGDVLNPIVVEHISHLKTYKIAPVYYQKKHLMCIGSILHRANKHSIVWGSGFIEEAATLNQTPQLITAVRGPKTRDRLMELGVEVPKVFGDPALFMPEIFNPKVNKIYELGIAPHYVDKTNPVLKKYEESGVKIIDVQNSNPLLVIEEMLQCKSIASSSLHGLILSDAYAIPNAWIKLSDKVYGGDFKFEDYFLSIGRDLIPPIEISNHVHLTPQQIIESCKLYNVKLDLELLRNAFPILHFSDLNNMK